MKRKALETTVSDELAHIPRGEYHQNVLRAVYNMQRRHDLAGNPDVLRTRSLEESVRLVRKEAPTFEPMFDRAFFAV